MRAASPVRHRPIGSFCRAVRRLDRPQSTSSAPRGGLLEARRWARLNTSHVSWFSHFDIRGVTGVQQAGQNGLASPGNLRHLRLSELASMKGAGCALEPEPVIT